MEAHKDTLKWFGEGFDGFPKRLPEDCLEYAIRVIDLPIPDQTIGEELRKIQCAAIALEKNLLKDYIWQRESFTLELVLEDGTR
jgi:hypothetical protein